MIAIGTFIKIQRTKQKMTLGELSKGIVSLSYLSKIENQKTEASEEIIQQLCMRLGISIDRSQEALIGEKCLKWYKMLTDEISVDAIVKAYEEIQQLMDKNLSEHLIMFEIHKIRFFLLTGKTKAASKKINELKQILNSFNREEKYFWFKYNGNYALEMNNFYHAMFQYKRAEKVTLHYRLEDVEEADLKYLIAITHTKLRSSVEAIEYAEEALDIYVKRYLFQRCAQCHNILGISYRRIKQYEKAITNFNHALHLAKLVENKEIIQSTYKNLGYLYSSKGDSRKAIEYYLEVFNDDDAPKEAKVEVAASLVREYYHLNSLSEVKSYIQSGLSLFYDLDQKESHLVYKYALRTYSYLIENKLQHFEEILMNDFLPLLKKQKDYGNYIIYTELLAKHYETENRYEEAANYYREATQAYKNISHI